jgi:hypothetical protein
LDPHGFELPKGVTSPSSWISFGNDTFSITCSGFLRGIVDTCVPCGDLSILSALGSFFLFLNELETPPPKLDILYTPCTLAIPVATPTSPNCALPDKPNRFYVPTSILQCFPPRTKHPCYTLQPKFASSPASTMD